MFDDIAIAFYDDVSLNNGSGMGIKDLQTQQAEEAVSGSCLPSVAAWDVHVLPNACVLMQDACTQPHHIPALPASAPGLTMFKCLEGLGMKLVHNSTFGLKILTYIITACILQGVS